jgi:hypothetical protein
VQVGFVGKAKKGRSEPETQALPFYGRLWGTVGRSTVVLNLKPTAPPFYRIAGLNFDLRPGIAAFRRSENVVYVGDSPHV